jgi:hypothetical protein
MAKIKKTRSLQPLFSYAFHFLGQSASNFQSATSAGTFWLGFPLDNKLFPFFKREAGVRAPAAGVLCMGNN